MRVLGIDTAAPVVGVAGWMDGELVVAEERRVSMGADAWLTPAVARVLDRLGGLDRVAVAAGPGAFTGVRVGVATALGLALARGVPVRAFSSLGARALLAGGPGGGAPHGPGEVIAALDARRGRAYAGRFRRGEGWDPLGEEGDLPPAEAFAGPPAWVVGEGALAFAAVLEAAGHRAVEDPARSPLPVAWPLVARSPDLDPGAVTIHYLRVPDVERGAD